MNKRHILLLKIDKGGEHWLCADGTIDYITKPIIIPGRKRFYDYIGNSGTEDGYLDYRGDSDVDYPSAKDAATYYSLDTTATSMKIGTYLNSVLSSPDPETGERTITFFWRGWRGFIRFDTSSIDANAIINSVTLNLTVSYKYNCYSLKVYKRTWYPLDSEDWAYGILMGSIAASNIPAAESSFDIPLDVSSVTKAGYTELQLATDEDSYVDGSKELDVYSANNTTGKPQLTVNYSLNVYVGTGYLRNSVSIRGLGSAYLKGSSQVTYNVPTSTSYVRGSLSVPTPSGTGFLNGRLSVSGRPAIYRYYLVNGIWNIQQIDAEPPIIIQRAADKPSIVRFYATTQLDEGDKLLISDGVYTWTGVVIKTTRDLTEYAIEAADYLHYLQNIQISSTYLHKTDIEIITDILSQAVAEGTPSFRLTTNISPRLIGQIKVEGDGLSCLQQITQKFNRHFYLKHDAPNVQPKLIYVEEDNGSYPLTIAKGNNLLNGWSVEKVTLPIKNHILCNSKVADLPAEADAWTNSTYPFIAGPQIPITDDTTTNVDLTIQSGGNKISILVVPTIPYSHWLKLKVRAKKVGSPTQPLSFQIYRSDTGVLLSQYALSPSALGTDYQDIEVNFDLPVWTPERNYELRVSTAGEVDPINNYYLIQGIRYPRAEADVWHFFNFGSVYKDSGSGLEPLKTPSTITVPLIVFSFNEPNSYGWILEGGALSCSNHALVASNQASIQFYFPDENASARLDLPTPISLDDYQQIKLQAVFPWGIEIKLCENEGNYILWRMTPRPVPFEFYKLSLGFDYYMYKKIGNPDLGNLKYFKISGMRAVVIDELLFEGKTLIKEYMDETSIRKYGQRKEKVEINDLFYTISDIDSYCQWKLDSQKDPQPSYLNFQVSDIYDIPLYSSVNINIDGTPISVRVIALSLDLTRRVTSLECGKYPIRLANILKKIKE